MSSFDFDYCEDTEVLMVVYPNGGCYEYVGVDMFLYEELMDAPSKGSFFVCNIKDFH